MKKLVLFLLAIAMFSTVAFAQKGRNGTTLAASKTLRICSVNDNVWRYSGVISVWNDGVLDTAGLNITDQIEYKTGNKWLAGPAPAITVSPAFIPAGTTEPNATIYHYSVDAAPLPGTIRNTVHVTITNHSGQNGPFGPSPKFTFAGEVSPCGEVQYACMYGHGHWKNAATWPEAFNRNAPFFLSGLTWQQIANNESNGENNNKYFQLAKHYLAVVVSQANSGLPLQNDIQAVINDSTAFFNVTLPTACSANGSCGLQNTWAGTLNTHITAEGCE